MTFLLIEILCDMVKSCMALVLALKRQEEATLVHTASFRPTRDTGFVLMKQNNKTQSAKTDVLPIAFLNLKANKWEINKTENKIMLAHKTRRNS